MPFKINASGYSAALDLGNGAVFKLVSQSFLNDIAVVAGLVGAFGVLAGFIPPLKPGFVKDATGPYTIGFDLLSFFALVCLAVNYFTSLCGGK